jgi:peptidoglycan/LPS O-acetylase OafA/YrhL
MFLGDRSNSRDNGFDALRFAAATLVIFSHSYPIAGVATEPIAAWTGYQTGGALAVFIFFSMSGFLISKSWSERPKLLDYAQKRFLRIMPGFIAATLFAMVVVGPLATNLPWKDYFRRSETWSYLNNVFMYKLSYFLPGVFETNPYKHAVNGSLWSLPIEVYMYLAVPMLGTLGVFLGGARRMLLLALTTLLVAIDWHIVSKPEHATFVWCYIPMASALSCAIYFAIGAIYYTYRHTIPLTNDLAGLAFVVAVVSFRTPFVKLALLLAIPYLVFWVAYTQSWLWNAGKRGDVSYGLYIYAFPVQQLIAQWVPGITPTTLFVLSFLVTFIIAMGSWRWIEKPCLTWARGRREPPRLRIVDAA